MERSRNGRTTESRYAPPAAGRARQRAYSIAATPVNEDLQELEELLRTAGVATVGAMVQKRDQPHPNLATLSLGKLGLRRVANLLGTQLADDGIRVLTLTVNGAVEPGTPFDPDHIAERYRRAIDDAKPGFVDEHFNGA